MKKYKSGASRATPTIPKVQKVKYASSVQNRAVVRGSQYRENLTFDPVVYGTNNLLATNNGAVAVAASGYITPDATAHVLNQVFRGTTSTNRIGRHIYMRKIRIQGFIRAGGVVGIPTHCRMALVYIPRLDKGHTTMPPQNVIWTSQSPFENRVLDNSERFRVIREWKYKLIGEGDAPTTGLESYMFDEMVDINRVTKWAGANQNGDFDAMEEGALCLYCHTDNTIASNLGAIIRYSARLYFDDK